MASNNFIRKVTFKCPTQAHFVLSYLLDVLFRDNYHVQRQVLTAALGSPQENNRLTGSSVGGFGVCLRHHLHGERGDSVRQPDICRALSLAPERELLKKHKCKISLMTGGGEKR